MTKSQAIELFGSAPKLAAALGVTRQRVYQLPEELSTSEVDRIVGAAMRLGLLQKHPDGMPAQQ